MTHFTKFYKPRFTRSSLERADSAWGVTGPGGRTGGLFRWCPRPLSVILTGRSSLVEERRPLVSRPHPESWEGHSAALVPADVPGRMVCQFLSVLSPRA